MQSSTRLRPVGCKASADLPGCLRHPLVRAAECAGLTQLHAWPRERKGTLLLKCCPGCWPEAGPESEPMNRCHVSLQLLLVKLPCPLSCWAAWAPYAGSRFGGLCKMRHGHEGRQDCWTEVPINPSSGGNAGCRLRESFLPHVDKQT